MELVITDTRTTSIFMVLSVDNVIIDKLYVFKIKLLRSQF
jgi:hypothetical protein